MKDESKGKAEHGILVKYLANNACHVFSFTMSR